MTLGTGEVEAVLSTVRVPRHSCGDSKREHKNDQCPDGAQRRLAGRMQQHTGDPTCTRAEADGGGHPGARTGSRAPGPADGRTVLDGDDCLAATLSRSEQ